MKKGVPDYHNSHTFQQLWDALGSKLIEAAQEHLTFNQVVAGSSPARLTSLSKPSLKVNFRGNQGVGF